MSREPNFHSLILPPHIAIATFTHVQARGTLPFGFIRTKIPFIKYVTSLKAEAGKQKLPATAAKAKASFPTSLVWIGLACYNRKTLLGQKTLRIGTTTAAWSKLLADEKSKTAEHAGVFKVRPSGVLIEDNQILLVKQNVTAKRQWSLPGGALERGETLEHCLVRELKEETGLDIKVGDLLFVTDRITEGDHVVHMTFLINKTDEKPLPKEWTHMDPYTSATSKPLREVRMISCEELAAYGFGATFCQLVRDNFPGRGAYKGDFREFYGEL